MYFMNNNTVILSGHDIIVFSLDFKMRIKIYIYFFFYDTFKTAFLQYVISGSRMDIILFLNALTVFSIFKYY